ncbi:helix-turn-helix domain-containing protein [Halovenus sp. WSH3]|uniref:Helix-turn-helix domain-containing protein n=1 Tax=Halovenus carboxidivorans TaxID=2692199 RepID=A0A6B0T2Z3_9EURY|nr:helix-turn-helix domain-containing protein [Halovenus carboxidivorans]
MIDISMEMEQQDCPFIDTTADYDVSFSSFQWNFDGGDRELETRMVVEGQSREALDNALQALQDHRNMYSCTLRKRMGNTAHIRTTIDETDAMETIREYDGYVTGPFHIEGGSETWHVGFDSTHSADNTLSDLDRNNEFTIISRRQTALAEMQELIEKRDAAIELLRGSQSLTATERKTIATAFESGYFQSPRETTLSDLAEEFDISKPGVSKNLRRGQRKITQSVAGALEHLDDPE